MTFHTASPLEKALAFTHGLLCEARKLTHVAYLRRDPLVPELLGIKRIASQSALSRFFAGFASAATNLRTFHPLWHWYLDRLPKKLRLLSIRCHSMLGYIFDFRTADDFAT